MSAHCQIWQHLLWLTHHVRLTAHGGVSRWMPYLYKFDHPPLLPPGRHPMTISQLRELTVTPFPAPSTRHAIFAEFEAFVAELQSRSFRCEILCNGSFVTTSPDPSDIDVVVRIDHDFNDQLATDQAAFFDSLNDDFTDHVVDTFGEVFYPLGHQNFGAEEGMSWEAHYGLEHGQVWLKGLAVLKVGETDVGLRLRR